MFRKLTSLFCILGTCFAQDTPGFQFLGFGYDALVGNPLSTTGTGDGGFRTNVFKFTHDEGQKTADGKWDVPDKTTSQSFSSCSESQDLKIIDSTYTYTHVVEDTFELDAGFAGVTASFSIDSKDVESSTHNHTSIFAHISSVCSAYQLTMHQYDAPAVDPNFAAGVKYLPTTYDEAAYMEFIANFGTHVVYSLKAGGRWGWQSEFLEDDYVSLLDYSIDVGLGLSYAGKVTAGIKFDHKVDLSTMYTVTNVISKNSTFSIGGAFSPDVTTWMENVQNDPMPVQMSLSSIDKFFTSLHVPDVDDIEKKQEAMSHALDAYCAYRQKHLDPTVSCDPPQPVPPPTPHPLADDAVRQVCVENSAGFAMYFVVTDVDSSTGLESTSATYPAGHRECVDAFLVHPDMNDRVKCTVQAIAGARQDCNMGDKWYPYDQRSGLRAVYKCGGGTFTYSCDFQGLESMW